LLVFSLTSQFAHDARSQKRKVSCSPCKGIRTHHKILCYGHNEEIPQNLNHKLNKWTFCNTHTSLEDGKTGSGRLFKKKKMFIHNSNCFLCTLVVFRHSYVQLQTARSQQYQLYVLHYNTASNAHFVNCHLLYCIISFIYF